MLLYIILKFWDSDFNSKTLLEKVTTVQHSDRLKNNAYVCSEFIFTARRCHNKQ